MLSRVRAENVGCVFLRHSVYVCGDVTVHLTGMCSGRVFEDRDVTFTMGCGSEAGIVPGVEMALKKFHQGEKSRLKVSSQYGYGSEGCQAYDIAPDAELAYEVEMQHFVRVILSRILNLIVTQSEKCMFTVAKELTDELVSC